MKRRTLLAAAAALPFARVAIFSPTPLFAHPGHGPVADLHARFPDPVRLAKFDVVTLGDTSFVRATAEDGSVGVVPANNKLPDFRSLFDRLAVPFFTGKDARDLVRLVDEVYADARHYKYAGMPFWNAVAHCELAAWDLLGRRAGGSVANVAGRMRRRTVRVYVSRFERDNTAEQEAAAAARALELTGANAVKLKVGRRMSTTPAQDERDVAMVAATRRLLGDGPEIFLDANGSYTAAQAIAQAKRFAEHRVGFLEEPCPWEEDAATAAVSAASPVPVAGGEQDSSLAKWRSLTERRIFSPCQPDLYYCGGLVRLLTIAALADAASLPVTPHAPRTGLDAHPDLVVRSLIPNLGPYQEYRESPEVENGKVAVPQGPGWGLPFTDDEVRMAA